MPPQEPTSTLSTQEASQQQETCPSVISQFSTLLNFQQQLLSLIHTQVYSSPVSEDSIVKFQIKYISEMNQEWKRMIDQLMFTLVRQKQSYEPILRDLFQKVINVDFIPFLRINRHELTQVSLYGFDIYVEPLSAILEILNRIHGQHHILQKYASTNEQAKYKQDSIWETVAKGWNQFIYQSSLTKISINVYMLKQYLKVAGNSLLRKDKQIVFTGSYNFFNELVPILKSNKQFWLITEFAELNNDLNAFHPSFNYSHLHSLLLPLQNEYEPIFRPIKTIAHKCMDSNILTPLLLSLLRSRSSLLLFISQIDDQIWVEYLNGLVCGLIFNFKIGILQYEEALSVLQSAIQKLGLLGSLDISYFTGQIGKEWGEAREFFVSALKAGYNVGELQTWHPVDSRTIQESILTFTKDSLLMQPQLPSNIQKSLFFPQGFDVQLKITLQSFSNGMLDAEHLKNNFSPNVVEALEAEIQGCQKDSKNQKQNCQKKVSEILKLGHLIELCELTENAHTLCYILSLLNGVSSIESKVLSKRISAMGAKFCTIGISMIQKQSDKEKDLKQVIFAYIKKNKGTAQLDTFIRVCLMISSTKDSISEILAMLQSQPASLLPSNSKLAAAHIISVLTQQELSTPVEVSTFSNTFLIPQEILNPIPKLHAAFTILASNTLSSDELMSLSSSQIVVNMCKMCPWLIIPLLSFPVACRYDRNQPDQKLQSFALGLLKSEKHELLLSIISTGFSLPKPIFQYYVSISLISICEQFILQINRILQQQTDLEDNRKYFSIVQMLEVVLEIHILSKDQETILTALHLQKIIKLFNKCLFRLDAIINGEGQGEDKLPGLIAKSILKIYTHAIGEIFGDKQKAWRIYAYKLCRSSVDLQAEPISNLKDLQIPSIRKDRNFLIHTPSQTTLSSSLSNSQAKARAKSLFQTDFPPTKSPQLPQLILPSVKQIQQSSSFSSQQFQHTKQLIPPSLSKKSLEVLLDSCSSSEDENLSRFLLHILGFNVSNHRKFMEKAIQDKNKLWIIELGLTREVVPNLLSQILNILNPQEISQTVLTLDTQNKKNISDNFNLMILKQQFCNSSPNQTAQNESHLHTEFELLLKLSTDLGFLLIYNQSNWRYTHELFEFTSTPKSWNFSNAHSVLLQYLEYIKIINNHNQDYEIQISKYSQILNSYQNLLAQKLMHFNHLLQQSKDSNNKFAITHEEIELMKVNQLGYARVLCDAWGVKEFLQRASWLWNQVKTMQKYHNISTILKRTLLSLVDINKMINKLARGKPKMPDFVSSFSMCSQTAFDIHNIHLGEHIERFDRTTNPTETENVAQLNYKYLQLGQTKSIDGILKDGLGDIKNITSIEADSTNETQVAAIIQRYNCVLSILVENKKIKTLPSPKSTLPQIQFEFAEPQLEGQAQQKETGTTEQQDNANVMFFQLGLLYSALQNAGKISHTLCYTMNQMKQRKVVEWQAIKELSPQNYHHIKSILIDAQIETRSHKFMHNGKPLIPHGDAIEVNKLNRQKYCNLVAQSVVGQSLMKMMHNFGTGCASFIGNSNGNNEPQS